MRSAFENRLRISRRGFLKASGATTAAAVAGAPGALAPILASAQQSWDAEHDVVVVGSGAAAFAAAITARLADADVVMYEKGAVLGGTTLVSGGGGWFPNNIRMQEDGLEDPREDALKYMARYSFPHLYNPESETLGLPEHDFAMLSRYYDTANEVVTALEQAGAITWQYGQGFGPHFDQIQIDYMEMYEENVQPTHRTLHPDDGGKAGSGGMMIHGYTAWAKEHDIEMHLHHRVDSLVVNSAGEVVGVKIAITGEDAESTPDPNAPPEATPATPLKTLMVRAKKGVIFGSGGFARNEDMMRHLMPAPYYGGCSAITNEGDLLQMSAALGAKLGNLHNVWRNEGLFEQAIASTGAYNCSWFLNGDSFLQVNKNGKRYVNEKRAYQDRPMAHHYWDANVGDWTNRLSFYVYDQRQQDNWGGRFPLPNDPATAPYVVTGDTMEELADALRERVESLREHTGAMELSEDFAANLVAEVDKFNGFARDGVDTDFQRGAYDYDLTIPFGPYSEAPTLTEYPSADQPNVAMYPLSDTGPYYAFIMTAAAVDTSGGPVINPSGQIIRWDNSPIVGLYGAGNCVACPGVNAYWGGGATIGHGHVWGYNAARHAVASDEKSVD